MDKIQAVYFKEELGCSGVKPLFQGRLFIYKEKRSLHGWFHGVFTEE